MTNYITPYELFFEQSPDLLCIAGYDGYFKKVNQAVASLLGYSIAELYSKPINYFIHPDDQSKTNDVRNELKKAQPLYFFENRYQSKSGETIWLSWTSHPVPEEECIFAIAKNITHLKKLERERIQQLSDLNKRVNKLKTWSYSLSHDLRAPVNNILSIIQLINQDKIQDPEVLELIRVAQKASEQLHQKLNTQVASLKQQDQRETTRETTKISHSFQFVVQSIKSLIDTTNTKISYDFSAFDSIHFKKTYLDSIFLNLITNSIKYKQAHLQPCISIRTELQNNKPVLLYEDNGLGFDLPSINGNLFKLNQRFHQHADSNGIGLYLIHQFVTSLNGTIEIKSQVNKGSQFYITF